MLRLNASFAMATCLAASSFAADLPVGTWKMNLEKSKSPYAGVLQNLFMTLQSRGPDTLHLTFVHVYKDGRIETKEDVRTFDGRERLSRFLPGFTSVSERVGEEAGKTIVKRDGKQVMLITATVSPDGRVITSDIKGVDPKGKPFEEQQVFEKQDSFVLPVSGAARPNLTGKWKCNLEASRNRQGNNLTYRNGGWLTLDIQHQEPELRITVNSGGHAEPVTFTMTTDAAKRTQMIQGKSGEAMASWDGSVLDVYTKRTSPRGVVFEVQRSFRMAPDGKTMRAELDNRENGRVTLVASEIWEKQ